jgi:amino acid permease
VFGISARLYIETPSSEQNSKASFPHAMIYTFAHLLLMLVRIFYLLSYIFIGIVVWLSNPIRSWNNTKGIEARPWTDGTGVRYSAEKKNIFLQNVDNGPGIHLNCY